MALTAPAYARAAKFLDSVSWRGIKPGLERTRALLYALGGPDAGLRGVLVAGTNGKGSVCALIDSVARAAGLHSVLLTKPHLRSYTERMVSGGAPVSEDGFATLMSEVRRAAGSLSESLQPTAFEMLTAAGILFAARAAPDLVVCEVGLGGRLDSTNVLDLGVAVITNVDLDHQEFLGETVTAIGREKAAIIKPGNVAITAAVPPARAEVQDRAHDVGAELVVVGEDAPVRGTDRGLEGIDVETRFDGQPLSLRTPLIGAFQIGNVAVAVAACDALRRRGLAIDAASVAAGCAAVRWPGRMQWIRGAPPLLVDGAHNPAAMSRMVSAAGELLARRRRIVVLGVMQDKDRSAMFAELRRLRPDAIVATAAAVDRALPAQQLAAELGTPLSAQTAAEALATARDLAGPDGAVVVAGSLYLAGEVLGLAGVL